MTTSWAPRCSWSSRAIARAHTLVGCPRCRGHEERPVEQFVSAAIVGHPRRSPYVKGEPWVTATMGPAVSTSTTTAAPDVSVVPPAIDEPYLNAVLAALDEVDGQATRLIHQTKRFPPEAAELLNAIYSDERFQIQADAIFTALAQDPELTAIKTDPGNRRTTVRRVITASPGCVWVEVERDHAANSAAPASPRVEYVALRPLDGSNDPRHLNPTAWMITAEGFNPDGTEPGNQCIDS